MNRLAALTAVLFTLAAQGTAYATSNPPRDPLVIKHSTVNHEPVQIARAVWHGRLYVFYYVYHDGIWWLLDMRPAETLPK